MMAEPCGLGVDSQSGIPVSPSKMPPVLWRGDPRRCGRGREDEPAAPRLARHVVPRSRSWYARTFGRVTHRSSSPGLGTTPLSLTNRVRARGRALSTTSGQGLTSQIEIRLRDEGWLVRF